MSYEMTVIHTSQYILSCMMVLGTFLVVNHMMVCIIHVIMSCLMVLSCVLSNRKVKLVTYITHWIVSRTKDLVTLMMVHYIMVFVTQVFGCLI